MMWNTLHTFASFAVVALAIFMLRNFRNRYNVAERLGLGLIGGGGILRINVIWEMHDSPFFSWAPTLFCVGFMLFMAGRAARDWHHEWGNWSLRMYAWAHLKWKGKL